MNLYRGAKKFRVEELMLVASLALHRQRPRVGGEMLAGAVARDRAPRGERSFRERDCHLRFVWISMRWWELGSLASKAREARGQSPTD